MIREGFEPNALFLEIKVDNNHSIGWKSAWSIVKHTASLSGENQQLVTDEPVEFEK
jgi:hypothetical protein